MNPINGKRYPLWEQFVDKKEEWIGGTMQEFDSHCGPAPKEIIKDVRLEANGKDSAMLHFDGETYTWATDVECLYVDPSKNIPNGIALGARMCGSACHITKNPNPKSETALTA